MIAEESLWIDSLMLSAPMTLLWDSASSLILTMRSLGLGDLSTLLWDYSCSSFDLLLKESLILLCFSPSLNVYLTDIMLLKYGSSFKFYFSDSISFTSTECGFVISLSFVVSDLNASLIPIHSNAIPLTILNTKSTSKNEMITQPIFMTF